jgi:hypothetical protein
MMQAMVELVPFITMMQAMVELGPLAYKRPGSRQGKKWPGSRLGKMC